MDECRICLCYKTVALVQPIFDEDDDNLKYSEKILQCTSTQIAQGENIPHVICTDCIAALKVAYKFYLLVKRSNTELLKRNNNSKTSIKKDIKQENNFNSETEIFRDFGVKVIHNSTWDQPDGNDFAHDNLEGSEGNEVKDENVHETISGNIKVEVNNDTAGVVQKKSRKAKSTAKIQNKQFFCHLCGLEFRSREGWRSHSQRHSGEKKFICGDCGKTFATKNDIRKHSYVHSGLKPYVCRYCVRAFRDSSSRVKHERCHRDDRPYRCNDCGKAFNYSYLLKKHILSHTGIKKFGCSVCNKFFGMKYHLASHIQRVHKDMDDDTKHNLLLFGSKLNTEMHNE